jgi:hypothetical protein
VERNETGLVQCVLQALAGPEARLLGRLDVDLGARLRIAPFSAGALGHDEYAKAGQSYLVSGLECIRDHFKDAVDGLGRIVFGEPGVVCQSLDEIDFVH